MSKEARYVVRLSQNGYTPADQSVLLQKIKDLVRPLSGVAMNLRVSDFAIEFDLFCAPEADLNPFLTALAPVGGALSRRRLDIETPPPPPDQVIAEARELFNEQRFWEFHEVLEGLWKKTSGEEKQLLQGLILAAAAFVHVQKNEPGVVFQMLRDAVARLEHQPADYQGIDLAQLLSALQKIILTKNVHFPTI